MATTGEFPTTVSDQKLADLNSESLICIQWGQDQKTQGYYESYIE